ncbi:MAG: TonB-dependent receptor [Pseudomonadota bacterium]
MVIFLKYRGLLLKQFQAKEHTSILLNISKKAAWVFYLTFDYRNKKKSLLSKRLLKNIILKLHALYILIVASPAIAQEVHDDDMALAYGDISMVSIATGNLQPLSQAPSTATVITSQDIEAMGAVDLDQALASVPGLHVSQMTINMNSTYEFRGIASQSNPQVLMLINGIPITNVFTGNRSLVWGGFPLENVSRIEIIRGPGSAVYGADAFSGVINIITKTFSETKGTKFGMRAGNLNTQDFWIQNGSRLGALESTFYLRVGKTDGQKGIIQKDLQSGLDSLFGTQASLAPGALSASRKALDARVDLAYGNYWHFRTAYQQREVGSGAGLAESLDPSSQVKESRIYLDMTYNNDSWKPNWKLSSVIGYYDIKEKLADPAFMLFPPGAFGGAFPNGVIGNPGHSERHTHASMITSYTGFKKHRLGFGAGFRIEDLYEASESKNYNLVTVPGIGTVFQPLGSLVDVTGDASLVYMQPHKRNVTYVLAQDEWSLVKDWTLTAGVRQDHYSDFGNTTNPRLALVWDASYNIVVKALHGKAFRAPSFVEQYNINNPVTIGNPNLKPETISTNELSISWQPTLRLQTNLSLFRYRMNNIIQLTSNPDPSTGSTTQNTGSQTGKGFEFEATWEAMHNLKLTGSFSLQHSIDDATGQDAGLAPHRRFFARADWRFMPLWKMGAMINHVADRKRQPGDTRSPIADYTTVGLSMQRENIVGEWTFRASINNLFNQDAREPTLSPGNIPYDLPLPGRTFYVQFEHAL